MRYDKAIKRGRKVSKYLGRLDKERGFITDMDVEKREIYLLHKKREVVEIPKRCGVKVLNIFEVLYIKVLGFGAKILNKPMVCKGVSMNYAPNPGFEFFCLQKGTSTGKCPRISG